MHQRGLTYRGKNLTEFCKVLLKRLLHRGVAQPSRWVNSEEILFTISLDNVSVLLHNRDFLIKDCLGCNGTHEDHDFRIDNRKLLIKVRSRVVYISLRRCAALWQVLDWAGDIDILLIIQPKHISNSLTEQLARAADKRPPSLRFLLSWCFTYEYNIRIRITLAKNSKSNLILLALLTALNFFGQGVECFLFIHK
jgi:hypothetical protein